MKTPIDLFSKLPAWVKGGILFISLLISFLIIVKDNIPLVFLIIIIVLPFLWITLVFFAYDVYTKKTPSVMNPKISLYRHNNKTRILAPMIGGIFITVTFYIWITLLYNPSVVNSIRSAFKLTSTPSPFPTISESQTTITPTSTSTEIIQVIPTLPITTTIPEKDISTSSSDFVGAFLDGCISKDWLLFQAPSFNQIKGIECKDLTPWGMVAKEDGLKLFISSEEEQSAGIYIPLEKGEVQVRFNVIISEIMANNFDQETNLYFGFVNPNTSDPQGEFLFYRSLSHNDPVVLAYGKSVKEKPVFFVSRNVDTETPQTILLTKNDLSIDFESDEFFDSRLMEIPLSSTHHYFWIGYHVPARGKLSVSIEDFEISK
jgi:hypothetical protein